jgi:hypothetical protein
MRLFLFFALDQFVSVKNVLLRDYTFQAAEIGTMHDGQQGRFMNVAQRNFQRLVGVQAGEAMKWNRGTKR